MQKIEKVARLMCWATFYCNSIVGLKILLYLEEIFS